MAELERTMIVGEAAQGVRPVTANWAIRGQIIAVDRPLIVGIINVTPDSFSDGGRHFGSDAAVAGADRLLAEGADILEVGGESTRPGGAVPVDVDEELRRLLPPLREIVRRHPDALVAVDTVKAAVARAALAEGAHIVNDVSALRLDAGMAAACVAAGAGVVLMHSRGGVAEMGTARYAQYGADVVSEVALELRARLEAARDAGLPSDSIVIDPGIGFAKMSEDSLQVLGSLPQLQGLGRPVMVGCSRKRFIGEITGIVEPASRVAGSVGANVAALYLGARLFRVHDVRATREAIDVAWQIWRRHAPSGPPAPDRRSSP
ncbi:MAG: dihydropteroate synthase [Gemmatimonadaceae bacterium]